MKSLTFYEQVGIVIPGSVFLFGLVLIYPDFKLAFSSESISIGGFGIFLVLSYACGQLIAAVGNILETIYWFFRGGMPSYWVLGGKPKILSSSQLMKIQSLINHRYNAGLILSTTTNSEWKNTFWQIFCDVEKHGKTERIDTFNGLYGLNRGLFTATLLLGLIGSFLAISILIIEILFTASAFFLLRMDRFAKYYAKEIFIQFLTISRV